ncbi:sensor histidine kinase [Donghicola tyrosinivorans]|uniref:histidine kinase n=1 Tax=Donghicola tyrosinivorans TaxID=1652492 RepID=A0A2T0WHA5_9RHOB|nr:HAMP domain-containing sensor histidine kinase [Donghicola tyrosinivorans]PRY86091.1 histidine kinase/DNA gyrase B/HSP90-like ATPase [Donghicola tyrosinivorans]
MSQGTDIEKALSLIIHDMGAPLRAATYFTNRVRKAGESQDSASLERDLDMLQQSIVQAQDVLDSVRGIRSILFHSAKSVSFGLDDIRLYLAFEFSGADITFEVADQTVTGCNHLINLAAKEVVRNALTHSDARRAHVKIAHNDGELSVIVRDSGPGIDPAFADRATAPFQVGTIEKKRSGSKGMGLYYAQLAVEKLNGKLSWTQADDGFEVSITCPMPAG